MGFSRQEHWSGLPCPPPEDLPNPGTEPVSCLLHWQADSLKLSHQGIPVYQQKGITEKPIVISGQETFPGRVKSRLLGLLLSGFSHVRLCATPQTAAHQALPSLGFSKQEYWSGLPFPSPMHKSEK